MLSPFFVLGGGDSQLDGDVVEDYLGAPTRVGQHKHWHPFRRVHRYWLDEKNKSGKVSQLKCVPHMGAKMTCSGPALLNKLMAPVTCHFDIHQLQVPAHHGRNDGGDQGREGGDWAVSESLSL